MVQPGLRNGDVLWAWFVLVNANGNVSACGSESFSYDQANRLKSATINGVTSSYVYNGDGKRAGKTVGGVTTSYVYDVNTLLPVLLDDGSRKYVWGAGLAYTVKADGTLEVYQTDGLGSVRAITDSSGSVTQTYRTDEFGIPTLTQGTSSQPFQYTGEQRDGETGLVYLRARMYDPTIGRFLQRDPWGGKQVQPISLNRYSYARGNPVTWMDPSGYDPLGILAHQMIEAVFIASHPAWDAEVTFRGLNNGNDIRVDLYNWTTQQFYEIKPWNEYSAGVTQVAQRQALGLRPSTEIFPDIWIEGFLGLVTLHAWREQDGLILYEWQWTWDIPDPVIIFPYPFPGKVPSRIPQRFPRPRPQPAFEPAPSPELGSGGSRVK